MPKHYTILDKTNSRNLIFKIAIVFFVVCMTIASLNMSTAYAKSLKYVTPDKQEIYEENIEIEYLVPYSKVQKVIEEIEKMPDWVWDKFIIDGGSVELVNFIDREIDIEGHENDIVIGYYDLMNNIELDVNNEGIEKATLHEFGHYIDMSVFNHISASEKFQNIYRNERDSFLDYTKNDYATADIAEYFAEAFQKFYESELSSQNLYTYCPDTWSFIHALVN